MQIKPFKALFPKVHLIESPAGFCDDAKNSFKKYLETGLYDRTQEPGFYLYEIETRAHKHIGLVGLNHIEDFLAGRIKKHEDTLSEREWQQKELFMRWKAILKPVLVAHTPVPALHQWLHQFAQQHIPLLTMRFPKEDSIHRFWKIAAPDDIQYLQDMYTQHVTETYIADGHHRTTTTALLYQDPETRQTGLDLSHLFCAWFASDQLDILDYNRVVEGVKKIGAARLMARLSQLFDIEILDKARKPTQKHELTMCLNKDWYSLRWRDSVLQQAPKGHETLDTALLNDLVFKQIFGVEDVRTDTRITYVDGSKGLDGIKKTTRQVRHDRVGFVFFPVAFKDLAALADAGENLPPKSTYFEPRLKSGLLVRLLH
jgi:uncharacterized protein (DUF1015 family)